MTKGAGDPSLVLRKKRVKKWLKHSCDTGWFIAGHTRFATRGKVNRRNSHPFRYGRIIGSHNGMCDAPQKFKVDSEYLFYAINKARGDYQAGLEEIGGYWGLSWYDGEHFYLLSHSGEIAYEIIGGVLYYSSSWTHLDSCTGGDSDVLKEGQVIRISPDGTVDDSNKVDSPIKSFASKAKLSYLSYGGGYNRYAAWDATDDDRYPYASGRSSAQHYRNRQSGGRGTAGRKESTSWQHEQSAIGYLGDGAGTDTTPRDYDEEWQRAWADYCTDSEHTGSDDDHSSRYAG
jgi:hypothetical protein